MLPMYDVEFDDSSFVMTVSFCDFENQPNNDCDFGMVFSVSDDSLFPCIGEVIMVLFSVLPNGGGEARELRYVLYT